MTRQSRKSKGKRGRRRHQPGSPPLYQWVVGECGDCAGPVVVFAPSWQLATTDAPAVCAVCAGRAEGRREAVCLPGEDRNGHDFN